MKKDKFKNCSYSATWSVVENPLYFVHCPNCKELIFMSKPSTMELLKAWAKKFTK